MILTNEQFDKAFAEFQAFGPRRRISIEERWLEVLPEINPSQYSDLKRQCAEIEALALSLAVQVRDKRIPEAIGQKQLAQKYPSLTDDRRGQTWSQALYFSIK